jgi:hypothetical protein
VCKHSLWVIFGRTKTVLQWVRGKGSRVPDLSATV